MTRLAAPIGFALGCLAALALGPGLAELIVHSGMSPFEPVPVSALAGEYPYRGGGQ